jgi:osmotically-inducible protein OsmY
MRLRALAAATLFASLAPGALAQTSATGDANTRAADVGAVPADNTKANEAVRDGAVPSADQASNAKTDVQLAADIRKAIMGDKQLSTYAKNVKIVVHDGTVHLAGPVRSSDEKVQVERLATEQAGTAAVSSDITIAPK